MTLNIAALLFLFFGLGLFLSWFGSIGWAAVVGMIFFMLIMTLFVPNLRMYFPLFHGVVELVWIEGKPLSRTGPLTLWMILGAMSTLLSYLLFVGPGEKIN